MTNTIASKLTGELVYIAARSTAISLAGCHVISLTTLAVAFTFSSYEKDVCCPLIRLSSRCVLVSRCWRSLSLGLETVAFPQNSILNHICRADPNPFSFLTGFMKAEFQQSELFEISNSFCYSEMLTLICNHVLMAHKTNYISGRLINADSPVLQQVKPDEQLGC